MLTVLASLLLAATPLAQDSASAHVAALCARAAENAAPTGRPELASALAAATGAGRAAEAAFLRGCQRFADGQADRATTEFERAVKLTETNPVYHYWVARSVGEETETANTFRLPGLARKARTSLERATELAPGYLDAHDGMVEFYLAAPGIVGGSVDKARAQAGVLTRLNRYRGELAMLRIAQRGGDTTAVILSYEGLIAAYPDSTAPYSALALIHQARRHWAQAWRTLDRWIAIAPDSYAARYAIGRTAGESGQRGEEGEKHLRQYISHGAGPGRPSIAAAHWRLGMILEKRGQRAEARREYETAVKLDPSLKGAKDGLARLK